MNETTTKATHAPRPWEVNGRQPRIGDPVYWIWAPDGRSADGSRGCVVVEELADLNIARLIAAAPETLERLRKSTSLLERIAAGDRNSYRKAQSDAVLVVAANNAAIAKATEPTP